MREEIDPPANEDTVIVEVPGDWLVKSVNPRGDYTYVTLVRDTD